MRAEPDSGASFEKIRRRADFVAAAKGARWNDPAFGLQMRQRAGADGTRPRFGLTVTKKTAARAVERNRMRRRLREALRLGAALGGSPGHDYVIVARRDVLSVPFPALRDQLAAAIEGLSKRKPRGRGAQPRSRAP